MPSTPQSRLSPPPTLRSRSSRIKINALKESSTPHCPRGLADFPDPPRPVARKLLTSGVLGLIRRVMQQERVVSVQVLSQLQRTWTRLVISGKPNGLAEKPGLLASLERVGSEFNKLRAELGDALDESQNRGAAIELGTRAQISIDILIRNLFERTADVGFLAEDGVIIDSLASAVVSESTPEALRERLEEYVAKYSVYDDVAVYRANGTLHGTRLGAASR